MANFALLTEQARFAGRLLPFNHFSSGVHACFRRITTKWGVKFFAYRKQAILNHKLQGELASHSLAPVVGPSVFNVTRKGYPIWGFLTEVAQQIHMRDICQRHHHDLDRLTQDLIDNGYRPVDLHWGNVGRINGMMVVIDCGLFKDADGRRFGYNKIAKMDDERFNKNRGIGQIAVAIP